MRSFLRTWLALAGAGLLLGSSPNLTAQTPTADYRFQSSRSSSAGVAPDLTDLISPGQTCPSYCNAFATETVDGASTTVLTFPRDNGVALAPTTGVLLNNGIYTVAIYARWADVSGFKRILDFKNGTTDYGFYIYNGALNLYPYVSTPTQAVFANTYATVVLTRDATGLVKGYVDGVLEFSYDDSSTQVALIDTNNVLRFFQDNTSGGATGEDGPGAVSRIRIFDVALTAQQVAALNPCQGDYSVTTTAGAAIVPGTNDIGNHCDDCTTGIVLPFPVMFYDQVFSTANVSSNGNLQFSSNTNQVSQCLPTGSANNLISPGWTDLYTGDAGNGQGIFTSVSGLAPNRIFNIEWRTRFCCLGGNPDVNFEMRLYEGQRRIDFIYGAILGGGGNAPKSPLGNISGFGGIGIQRDTGSKSAVVSCGPAPTSGTQYTFNACVLTAISTAASAPTNLGGSISDTATVTGSVLPTGTVTFQLYGPNDSTCSRAPVFTSTVALDENGQATSGSFKPVFPGTYYFVATYNGDANNGSVATACGDANESVTVSGNEIDGRGTIAVSGGKASFNLTVQNSKKGQHFFSYSDPASHLSFTSSKLSPVTINGNYAHFTGTAKIGNMSFTFTVDAYDNGPWGDQFFISTSKGYMAGGTITGGDVEVHFDAIRR